MKKILSLLSLLSICAMSYAQCTVCSIDPNCTISPAYPGSCPANLPNDTVNQPYEATLTYFLPRVFDSGTIAGDVDFEKVEILGVTGLPAGMTWAAYDHTGTQATIFFPNSNPPSTERVCAKICGTPLLPGNYEAVVTARITVDAGAAGTQVVDESFIYPLEIYPSATGNAAFTASSTIGCGSVTSSFTTNVPSSGSNLYTYDWDMGNGVTSSSETIADQTYSTAGSYPVTHTITELKYQINTVSINTIKQAVWCGEVNEDQFCYIFGNPSATPEYYFTYLSGVAEQSSTISDRNPTWNNLEYDVNNDEFTVVFWEEDTDFINPDDSLGQQTVTINGTGNYTVDIINYENPSETLFTAVFTVELVTNQTVTATDTIHVFDFPNVGSIVPDNVVTCDGDTAELSISDDFENYSWYYDGTLIADQIDNHEIPVSNEGEYYVDIVDENGCTGSTGVYTFTYTDAPPLPQPSISLVGGLSLNVPNNPPTSYQWYKDGVLLPGENGISLPITEIGTYSVSATNINNCTTFSSDIEITFIPEPTGIDLVSEDMVFNVYPNPNTTGELTVDFRTNNSDNYQLFITDMLGKQVLNEVLPSSTNTNIRLLDISSLNAGMYMVGIQNNQRIIQMKRLIIK